MNTGSEEHLTQRHGRYDTNSKRESFRTGLKGLSVIELCITELCTRKCSFCPRADADNYPNQKLFMDIDTITNIGNSCKAHYFEGDFHISGFGESLTNKEFLVITERLRSILPTNRITLTTNGDLLTVDRISQIYTSGVNYIIVSCYDGEKAMRKFDKMFADANIRDNDYEIRELWKAPEETVDSMMRRNKFNNRSGAVMVKAARDDVNDNPCYLPFYKLVFDWNGEALLCCNDWYRRHKGFGNINEQSIKDIWLGEEFTKIRSKLKDGKRTGPACKHCNVHGTLVGRKSVDLLS